MASSNAAVIEHITRHLLRTTEPREAFCPGFQLYHKEAVFGSYTPTAGRDYDDGLPYTQLCDHIHCEPDAEIEYYLTKLVATGAITENQWTLMRPISRDDWERLPQIQRDSLLYPRFSETEFEFCMGYLLDVGPLQAPDASGMYPGVHWNPTTNTPYTKPCPHSGACDEAIEAKWAIIKAYASNVLPQFDPDIPGEITPLQKIQREGTSSFIRNLMNAGLDLATIFITMLNREDTSESVMWHPRSLYIEEEDEADTLPDVVSGNATDEHRIKSWFQRKTYNGFQSVMVHLKRKPRVSTRASTTEMYINFQLKDVPDVVQRLATYCVVNGIGSELRGTLTYLQSKLAAAARR